MFYPYLDRAVSNVTTFVTSVTKIRQLASALLASAVRSAQKQADLGGKQTDYEKVAKDRHEILTLELESCEED
jgi:hypothetical protein